MESEHERMEDFEQALKAWAQRPPRRSPHEAARLVVEAVGRRQRGRRALRTLLAVAALLLIAVGVSLQRKGPAPEATPAAVAPRPATPLGAGQALIWLDADTPLYMTFEAPAAASGGQS